MKKDDSERRWALLCQRSPEADFFFAVITTGIFCRPSCPSRAPRRENVRFYDSAADALLAGFRPCKRCHPDRSGAREALEARIAKACALMEESEAPLTLHMLAERAAMSPWHFHRQFKLMTGLTPGAWQRALRAERLRKAQAGGETVTRALHEAGYTSGGRAYRQVKRALGMKPSQYRRGGELLTLYFAQGTCQLGDYLIAESARGVCAVLLGDSPEALFQELTQTFSHARLLPGDAAFGQRICGIVRWLDNPAEHAFSLPLDLHGTVFQREVWQALQAIPAGETISYQTLAQRIGKPRTIRAVANACAANTLAVIVPCHRVVRQSGALSGYRWGSERKRRLLQREAAQEE